MPIGDPGPYRISSTRPATIVGSANGRSMSVLMTPSPGKLSRTSTQAISVPKTALMTTSTMATPIVSFSAATASGVVIAVQKLSQPPSFAW